MSRGGGKEAVPRGRGRGGAGAYNMGSLRGTSGKSDPRVYSEV